MVFSSNDFEARVLERLTVVRGAPYDHSLFIFLLESLIGFQLTQDWLVQNNDAILFHLWVHVLEQFRDLSSFKVAQAPDAHDQLHIWNTRPFEVLYLHDMPRK